MRSHMWKYVRIYANFWTCSICSIIFAYAILRKICDMRVLAKYAITYSCITSVTNYNNSMAKLSWLGWLFMCQECLFICWLSSIWVPTGPGISLLVRPTVSPAEPNHHHRLSVIEALLLLGPTVFRGEFCQIPRQNCPNSAAHHSIYLWLCAVLWWLLVGSQF